MVVGMKPLPPMGSIQARRIGKLDLATVGVVCVRASDAWRQIGVETSGSVAYLNKVTSNTARWQSRDGVLQRLLVEGSRTNLILRSGAIDNASWMSGNAAATANYSTSPDGTTTATRITCTSGGSGRNQSPAITQPGNFAASAFCKAASPQSGMLLQGQAAVVASSPSLTTNWLRTDTARFKTGEVAIEGVFLSDGRNWSGVGGIAAGARDWIWWGAQLEAAPFASSYIETAGASAARSADSCTVASASVPSWMRSGKYAFVASVECSSAQLITHATEMTLLAFGTGTNDRVALVLDSGAIKVRVVQGGTTRVTTGALTFSRWQDLTITLNSATGAVTIAGAATGNGTTTGTPWTMQSGDLYLGTTSTGTTPYFGEIDHLINQLA